MPAIVMLALASAMLSTMAYAQDTVDICDRTPQVRDAILEKVGSSDCAAVTGGDLAGVLTLDIRNAGLTTLKAGDFDGLTGLTELWLDGENTPNRNYRGTNQLRSLPAGVFDDLASLEYLDLDANYLTTLPAGVFDNLTSLTVLRLNRNQLATLPAGVFDNLTNLEALNLNRNRLASLPAGIFDKLANVELLQLNYNDFASLPAGIFDNLANVQYLYLAYNDLTSLAGLFDNLTRLRSLKLNGNRLEGVGEDHAWFASLRDVEIHLEGQQIKTTGALNLVLADSQSALGRQGFVRISNFSDEADTIRITATDDSGYSPDTSVEIRLAANQTVYFNSSDLENGSSDKGIRTGVGAPVQGDWRLQLEIYLPNFAYDAYVRTTDGFLTGLHRSVDYSASPDAFDLEGGAFTVGLFNPASNTERQSRLRIVNEGASPANIQIHGRDDMGTIAGPVTFSLPPNQVRTLSAVDLEQGASNVEGMLGDGAGKWRLAIQTDHHPSELDVPPMAVMNLLYSSSGQITSLD